MSFVGECPCPVDCNVGSLITTGGLVWFGSFLFFLKNFKRKENVSVILRPMQITLTLST